MRIALTHLVAAAPLLLAALPASAQNLTLTESDAIARGAYHDAEATLVKQLRVNPGRPELQLNLAAVYTETGRGTQARILYNQVLAEPEVEMSLQSGRASGSHAIARAGLGRVAAQTAGN